MADYRMPMDADGIKYHGTVDQNEENPGQFMYGLDENGNKRIIRTDENGNVLTRVTGSRVELISKSFFNLAPNEEVSTDYIETLDYTSFSISIWRSGAGSFLEVFKRERTSLATVSPNHIKVLEVSSAMGNSEPEDFIGSSIFFTVKNTGESTAQTIYFVVYGIK